MSITTMYSSPGTGKLFVVISLFFPAKVTTTMKSLVCGEKRK